MCVTVTPRFCHVTHISQKQIETVDEKGIAKVTFNYISDSHKLTMEMEYKLFLLLFDLFYENFEISRLTQFRFGFVSNFAVNQFDLTLFARLLFCFIFQCTHL